MWFRHSLKSWIFALLTAPSLLLPMVLLVSAQTSAVSYQVFLPLVVQQSVAQLQQEIVDVPNASIYTKLFDEARANGQVRVIVGVNVDGDIVDSRTGALSVASVQQQQRRIGLAQSSLLNKLSDEHFTINQQYKSIPSIALTVDAEGLARLATMPEVTYLREDKLLAPLLGESVSLVGAPQAWSQGFTGQGQTIVIIDTGVDANHPILLNKIVAEACFSSAGIVTDRFCPGGDTSSTAAGSGAPCGLTGCDHGTHVAGIAAGRGAVDGIGRDANIIAIQAFQNTIGGVRASEADINAALDHIFTTLRSQHTIAAVNMSLGGNYFTVACDDESPSTTTAIRNLRNAGIAVVVAAGNGSRPDAISWPSCISHAISVGNTGDGSADDFGANIAVVDTVWFESNSATFLDLLAPGTWIRSSVPGGGFATSTGTSMAAPHVSGAISVLKEAVSNAPVDDIVAVLKCTGVPIRDARNGIVKPRISVNSAVMALRAGVRYVDINAPSGGNGSVSHPFNRISNGINAVPVGGVLWAAAGMYGEAPLPPLNRAMYICNANDTEEVTIQR